MIAGIITVPERLEFAEALKLQLLEHMDSVHIFNDTNHNGCTWNWLACIEGIQAEAEEGEEMFFFTDDAILSKDFLEHYTRINNSAKERLYTLNVRGEHVVKLNDVKRREYVITKRNDIRFKYTFSDIGWMVRNDVKFSNLHQQYSDWLDRKNTNVLPSPFHPEASKGYLKHFDLSFSVFLFENNYSYGVTIPGLVKHDISLDSTLGHTPTNGNLFFIDDVLTLDKYMDMIKVPPRPEVEGGEPVVYGPFVPSSVTRAQAKAALTMRGLWDTVVTFVDGLPEGADKTMALISINDTNDWLRNSPMLQQIAGQLGLTSEDLDDLFILAHSIKL